MSADLSKTPLALSQGTGRPRLRVWLTWTADKVTLWLVMYSVTFSLFLYETGSLRRAATMGLIAASIKAAAAVGHRQFSRTFLGDGRGGAER